MEYVKHKKWFYSEIQGYEYRAKYIDYGWSYSSIKFQVLKTYKILGIPIKIWVTLIDCVESTHNLHFSHSSDTGESTEVCTGRRTLYDARKAKTDIQNCLKCYKALDDFKKSRNVINRV